VGLTNNSGALAAPSGGHRCWRAARGSRRGRGAKRRGADAPGRRQECVRRRRRRTPAAAAAAGCEPRPAARRRAAATHRTTQRASLPATNRPTCHGRAGQPVHPCGLSIGSRDCGGPAGCGAAQRGASGVARGQGGAARSGGGGARACGSGGGGGARRRRRRRRRERLQAQRRGAQRPHFVRQIDSRTSESPDRPTRAPGSHSTQTQTQISAPARRDGPHAPRSRGAARRLHVWARTGHVGVSEYQTLIAAYQAADSDKGATQIAARRRR